MDKQQIGALSYRGGPWLPQAAMSGGLVTLAGGWGGGTNGYLRYKRLASRLPWVFNYPAAAAQAEASTIGAPTVGRAQSAAP
jgi:hypothetical protein